MQCIIVGQTNQVDICYHISPTPCSIGPAFVELSRFRCYKYKIVVTLLV